MIESISPEPGETVAIYAAPDAIAAEIMRGMLEAEGIEAAVGEQVTGAYESALTVGEGLWGELVVRAEDAERARALIESYSEASGSAISDEELDAEAMASSDPGV